jgi:uroporphyrinogen decarboxylase
MFSFITDFTMAVLEPTLACLAPDVVELKEDMAYKHAAMISPEMFRSFMLPHYRRLVGFLRARGARVIYVDSDGDPTALIPLWREAGVDGMSPCEAAAGVDPRDVRRRFPGFAMLGGIDKRCLSRGTREVWEEVTGKVPRLVEQGGYIPHVDHAVPPDAVLANYVYCRQLIAAIAEGRHLPAP